MRTEHAGPTAADEAAVPNEDEVAREFPHGDGRPLREQTAGGSQNVVGGGEYPNTPDAADDD